MTHRLTLLLSCLLTTLVTLAAQVSHEEARLKATQFMASRYAAARGTTAVPNMKMVLDQHAYFVFNIGSGDGFVIVSGDDRAPAILGYSDTGSFEPQNMPDNMRAFLQGYADEMAGMAGCTVAAGTTGATGMAGKVLTSRSPQRTVRSSITPLLTTQWNQRSPYNDQCPTIGSKHAVTGCVATALAQVMNYHQYPIAATAAVNGLPSTTFDWNQMRDSYSAGDDGTEVAKLMHYCGVAVQMSYGADASSAVSAKSVSALVDYFDYDAGAKFVNRSGFGYSDWVTLLYNELSNHRPVLMGGQSTGGGHAFVCDGYDEDDFFHINWGWGGLSNGYFRLSNLAPDNQGAGGSSTADGYNLDLGAAIGVQPNTGSAMQPLSLTTTDVQWGEGEQFFYWTRMRNGNFQIYPKFSYKNMSGRDGAFCYGLRLLKDGEPVTEFIFQNKPETINNGSSKIYAKTIQFGNGLDDGTYRLVGIFQNGNDDWTVCADADKRYIECVISGNQLTAEIKNLGNPKPYLSLAGITGTDGLSFFMPQDVTVELTNSGDGDFHGDITLMLINGNTVYQKLGGAVADISAGQSGSVTVTINPQRTGNYEIAVVNGYFLDGDIMGRQGVSIAPPTSDVNIDLANLQFNGVNGTVYGNTFKASITAINNAQSDYKYGVSARLYKLVSGNTGSLDCEKTDNTVVVAGEMQTFDFEFPDLDYDEVYFCYLGYYKLTETSRTFMQIGGYPYKIAHGFVTIDADGSVTADAPSSSVTIPAEAVAVDLRGQETVASVTPNENPNCLYLLDADAKVPDGVSGKNIVKGGVAEAITLTDGADFVVPETFTAATVTYARTFTTGTDGTGGWTTLTVPFDVDKVTVDGVEKQWFSSPTDTGKHFWVKKLVSDDEGTVTFEDVDKIKANTPYLIAVPGKKWGDDFDLTGKTLVFTGYDKIVSTAKAVASGDYYRFSGTTRSLVLSEAYVMNANGTVFERGDVTVEPFRACFTAYAAGSSATSLQIVQTSKIETAVTTLPAELTVPTIYTLDGRRVSDNGLKSGVYIKNGKKVIR